MVPAMKGKNVTGIQWLWLTIVMPLCALFIILGVKKNNFGETLGAFLVLAFSAVFVWSGQAFWEGIGTKFGAFLTNVLDKF